MSKENKESKALQTQGTQLPDLSGLAQFRSGSGEGVFGLETVDRSDIKLPKIKLIQATSVEATKKNIPAGHFYNTVTGEHTAELKCHLLALGKSRVMWKKPFKRGEEPLCRSFDGVMRHDGRVACKTCQHQDWNRLPQGETKPACNQSYVWLGVTADSSRSPFRFIASGASVSNTKDFINIIIPNKLPPFVYNVVLTSEQQENESGVFYVAKYSINGVIPEQSFMGLKELAEGMKDMFMESLKNDEIIEVDTEDATDSPQQGGLF